MHGDYPPLLYKGYELREVFNVIYVYKADRYVIARRSVEKAKLWIDREEAGLPHEPERRKRR